MQDVDRELLSRTKVFNLSYCDFLDILEGKVKAKLPSGCRIVGVGVDYMRDGILVKVQNSEWPVRYRTNEKDLSDSFVDVVLEKNE